MGVVVVSAIGFAVLYVYNQKHPTNDPPTTTSAARGPKVISASEAWNAIGQQATVQYFVGYPYTSSAGNEFLNQEQNYLSGFTAVVYSDDISNFATDPLAEYGNTTVDVTGTITQYGGHPEMIVSKPSQIKAGP